MENETIEYKKSLIQLKEGLISIVAILNKHKKGTIYFEVDDVNEKTLRDISQTISNHIEPKIYPEIKQEKNYIIINFSGNEIPYFAYGRAYIRVSDEDKKMSSKELENFILNKNKDKLRWDIEVCEEAILDIINDETINKFKNFVKESQRLPFLDENKDELLNKLNLIKENKLTNAAILLFGNNPQKYFYNSTIRCGVFKNEDKEEFIDMKDIQGNLFECLEQTIIFIKNHIRLSAKIEGLFRKEKWEIPIEALREAIINALIHRNYYEPGFTYIKIYDDKIIISNPGKLPDEINIKDLYKKHESIPKNPLLAEIFYYTGLIDIWGRGSLNILRLTKLAGLKKPLFEQSSGYFRIIFKRISKEYTDQVSDQVSDQVKVLKFSTTEKSIQEIMKLMGLKHRTYFRKNILKPLLDKKLLELTIPEKPNSPKQKYKTTNKGLKNVYKSNLETK